MEALLQSSSVPPPRAPADVKGSPRQESVDARSASPSVIEKELANLVINETGEQKYIGPSSGFSILSPRGLAWIERKTGSMRMKTILQTIQRAGPFWASFRIGHQWDGDQSARFDLPSKEATTYLVNHYFKCFNASFPLFDRFVFWELFERQYSNNPPTKRSWFGVLNVVLSIGCITATASIRTDIQTRDPFMSTDMSDWPWRFFKNACSVLLDIIFLDTDLMGVQTVIGMAFVMQAIMNPEGAFALIGIAARLATSLGLHRWLPGFGLSKVELEQRQRVFWIMYILEKDLATRIGRPSAIDDDDIGFGPPSGEIHGEGEIAISLPSINYNKFYPFQRMCTLAIIESKVYKELYAVSSRVKTASERLRAISRLDAELQEWKENFPIEVRPEHSLQCDPESRFPIIVLHFGYYHCLAAIHRVNAHHELWLADVESDSGSGSPENPSTAAKRSDRGHTSYSLCLASARSILHLSVTYLDDWSDPRNKLIWIAPYFPVSAFLALFAHMLQSPLDPRAAGDQILMERILGCLNRVITLEDRSIVQFLATMIGELFVIARQHVDNVKARLSSPNSQQSNFGAEKGEMNPIPQGFVNPLTEMVSPLPDTTTPSQYFPTNELVTSQPHTTNLFNISSFPASDQTMGQNDNTLADFPDSMMDDPFFLMQDYDWDWSY
ncbi:uncharacterized protein Z518_04830 [Rhinocladiella mackenziei CBS 650.93]|uniref:Xylanolytic transcriptional activator regulatory domain-containing protein n=1 Tax=Rhinocladiella mackenziei CBS 650.93 TaxID=1442369 RepID=A0A0D2IM73_9EURO|nr:uncharacterized protein Z518_04830 [Rhinocladiella mackenziei CBS 650.93]KIX06854.1 hypothetical protein Z518_04830 [Rhinocladiella mackenziei CBS 650.93]